MVLVLVMILVLDTYLSLLLATQEKRPLAGCRVQKAGIVCSCIIIIVVSASAICELDWIDW